jgi:hypothetical protein
MSNGDITSLTIQGRFKLPGGGFKQDGTPTQNKAVLWGTIATSTADAGISINSYLSGGIKMLGLEELDVISFYHSAASGDAVGDEALYFFALDRGTTPKIHHLKNVGADDSAPIDAGDTITLHYFAVGTSLEDL